MRINSLSNSTRIRHYGSTPFSYKRPLTRLPRYGIRLSCHLRVKRKSTLKLKIQLRYRTVDLKVTSLATGLPYYKGYPQLSPEFTYGSD